MKIAICGYYGKSNFGDDLMMDYISSLFSGHEIKIYSDTKTDKITNGIADNSWLNSDLIIIGGGGIVDPKFWVLKNMEALKGKNIMFFNVSVYNHLDSDFIVKLSGLNAKWYVRDTQSYDFLLQNGINSVLIQDIALSKPPIEKTQSTSKSLIFYPNVYAFAPEFIDNNSLTTEQWLKNKTNINSIAKFLDWMMSFGWVVTIAHAQISKLVDDRIVGGAIYGAINNKRNVNWVTNQLSYSEHIKLIQDSDFVISMRYHTSLLAILNGLPCIDIIHHAKNMSLWDDIKYNSNVVNFKNFDIDSLIQAAIASEKDTNYKLAISKYCSTAHFNWSNLILDPASITK